MRAEGRLTILRGFGCDGEQVFCVKAQSAVGDRDAVLQVVRVSRRIVGNQHVVGVISTKQEDAHQRLIICGRLRQGIHQAETREAAWQCRMPLRRSKIDE